VKSLFGKRFIVMMARAYIPAPETLKAFPEAKRVKPKGLNRRWRDSDHIYEWDRLHGRVERYGRDGYHQGEFDPETGALIEPAVKGRRIEV
jgi:hypothetical protein